MKVSDLKVNSRLIEEGGWIDFSAIEDLDGVAFRVRGKDAEDYQDRLFAALAEVPTAKRAKGKVSPATLTKIEGRLIGELLVLDWCGLTDEDGAVLEFSRERAVQFCTDPDYHPLRALIELAVDRVASHGRVTLEAQA